MQFRRTDGPAIAKPTDNIQFVQQRGVFRCEIVARFFVVAQAGKNYAQQGIAFERNFFGQQKRRERILPVDGQHNALALPHDQMHGTEPGFVFQQIINIYQFIESFFSGYVLTDGVQMFSCCKYGKHLFQG